MTQKISPVLYGCGAWFLTLRNIITRAKNYRLWRADEVNGQFRRNLVIYTGYWDQGGYDGLGETKNAYRILMEKPLQITRTSLEY